LKKNKLCNSFSIAPQQGQPTAAELSQLAAHPEILLAKTTEASSSLKKNKLCNSFSIAPQQGQPTAAELSQLAAHPEILQAKTTNHPLFWRRFHLVILSLLNLSKVSLQQLIYPSLLLIQIFC
jgi:hypothetical protein